MFIENINCKNQILKDKNFYDDIKEKTTTINIMINIKKTKIKNILILIGLLPFLKYNSNILYKINSKEKKIIYLKNYHKKKIKNRIIKINENDFHYFIENFNGLINNKWKLIPDENIVNNIRYIVNNYYNESCKEIFDKSLNIDFESYILNKKSHYL